MKLDHVQITVPKDQETAARTFYCEILGLSELPKPEILRKNGGFWLGAGGAEVHVGLEDGVNRRATKSHLAFRVTDLDSIKNRLQHAGIEVQTPTILPGIDRFECRDPFGNRLEFLVRKPPAD
jgi:catechol 2,3-dioxygenase-like lactoylglutathione lyase family enzyme